MSTMQTRSLNAPDEVRTLPKTTVEVVTFGDLSLMNKNHLTHREREVLCLLAAGHTDRKIAESLTISPRTVNRHVGNIFVKLEVPSRAAAAAHAVRKGFI
jgi:DNA-binding CsgD family transcriptional regulator